LLALPGLSPILAGCEAKGNFMGRKPNYGYEKRQKEIAKKAKKEEKRKRKSGEEEAAVEEDSVTPAESSDNVLTPPD